MGFLNFLRPAVERSQPAARVEPQVSAAGDQVSSPSQWRGLIAGGAPSRAGVVVNETSALSLPATLQALRVLTGVLAMTPLHYYQRGENGRIRDDNAGVGALLLTRPNSHQSSFTFFELLWGDLLLAGNFFGYVSRNAAGEPVAITRLKPNTVLVSEYFDRAVGRILFYDATLPDGTRSRFAARDIWHIPGFSRDGINGLNPVEFMRDALGGAIATGNHASKFWAKGGRPSTVLQGKPRISASDKTQLREDWNKLYGSMDGEAVAVLDQDMKAEFLSHDMRANQFIETRQFQIVDLARIWGVPPHLIFDLTRSTNNNIEHQSLEFAIYHLGPHFSRLAGAANLQFAEDGFYFEHLTDALVKGDMKSRMESYWLQRQMGIVNANELRQRENAPTIVGEAGSEYWRPSNMSIAGQPSAPPVTPTNGEPAP